MKMLPKTTINRILLYKRILEQLQYEGVKSIFSHELAAFIGGSSAQIRRDIMDINYTGTTAKGYVVSELKAKISKLVDVSNGDNIAVVGMGNLGQILLSKCFWHYDNISLLIGFDLEENSEKTKINDCDVYNINQMSDIIKKEKIKIVILSVPFEDTKKLARKAILSGARGVINYSTAFLDMPPQVHLESMDLGMALEKISFFTRKSEHLIE